MLIFNSLTEKKEEIKKPATGKLRLFVCGPTVYDYSHIGHARTYYFFDTFVKFLKKYKKIPVFYLQNITDVDDKIIKRAMGEKENPFKIARFFEKEHSKDMEALGIDGIDICARASGYIREIQNQIQKMLDMGFAYKTSNGIYFEVKRFSEYGKLSRQNLDELRPGWRVEQDREKKDPFDFALWKFRESKPKSDLHNFMRRLFKEPLIIDGEPSWWSPWGWGRPGWHIEDTAITERFFGPHYEIHGAGSDLKFPHHESEIAQQESISGVKLVDIWIHTGHLMVNGQKMSKSLGNYITIRDFLKDNSPNILKMMFVAHYYRQPMDFTDNALKQAKESLINVIKFLAKIEIMGKKTVAESSDGLVVKINDFEKKFFNAMDDDFNTPEAIHNIFSLINFVNENFDNFVKIDLQNARDLILNAFVIFGISLQHEIPRKISNLAKKRELLRGYKQFIQADDLRKQINELGYGLEDTLCGPLVWPINV